MDGLSDDGATEIDAEEAEALIPTHLTSRAQLNQWEAVNIALAQHSAFGRRQKFSSSVDWLRDLHKRMFDGTWKWAGQFRQSDKNVSSYSWTQVPALMHDLVANTEAQLNASDKTAEQLDELAVRFHHQLTRIHPWPNGNGRHARLATDLFLASWERPPFTWGSGADLVREGRARSEYIAALRSADKGDFALLRKFARM